MADSHVTCKQEAELWRNLARRSAQLGLKKQTVYCLDKARFCLLSKPVAQYVQVKKPNPASLHVHYNSVKASTHRTPARMLLIGI